MYDFDYVARRERCRGVLRSRNHFAVALDGDGAVGEPEMLHQPAYGEPVRDVLWFAVHDELHAPDSLGVDRAASSD